MRPQCEIKRSGDVPADHDETARKPAESRVRANAPKTVDEARSQERPQHIADETPG